VHGQLPATAAEHGVWPRKVLLTAGWFQVGGAGDPAAGSRRVVQAPQAPGPFRLAPIRFSPQIIAGGLL